MATSSLSAFFRKATFLLLMVATGLLPGQAPNLVKNPSFEEVDERGNPVAWSLPGTHWRGSDENAYEGERSALFDCSDADSKGWLVQRVPLEPGKTYEYSAVMRLIMKEDAPADAKLKASIILEYSQQGQFTGGQYTSTVVDLNNGWLRLQGRAQIPQNMDAATIALLPSPRNSIYGKIWFDSVEIHETESEVFTCLPVTDRYRDEAAAGPVTVFCGRGEKSLPISEAILRTATLRLLQKGKVILESPLDELLKDRVSFHFDATALPVGEYVMQCRVVDPRNGREYLSENRFRKLAKEPDYRVHVDSHRRMIVDGKPFFPLGMYHKGVTEENLRPYIDSDFNCLIDYNPISEEMLDYLDDHGIKVFYANACVSSRSADKEKTRLIHEKGYAVIDRLKHHPAIIAWYINDELAVQYLQDAIDYRNGCEEHDPDRPAWTVLCNDFLPFLPASDIHGSDPYPVPGGIIGNAYRTAKRSHDATFGTKMIIQVPQAFSWGRYWKKYGEAAEKTASCPMPTYEQMDAMAWMAIAGGANGLIFYSYFDLLERDKESPGLPAIPFDKSFGDLRKIASRVKAHEEVLLSVEKPLSFKVISNPEDTVCFRTYSLKGTTWLLAVNTTEDNPGDFELDFEEPVAVEGVSLSKADVRTDGRKLAASLKPLQVIFIKLQHKEGKEIGR